MLNMLLEQVKNAIFNSPSTPHQPGHDPDGLIDQITGLFGQHQQQSGTMQNPRPASEDPYGDPADQEVRQGYGQQRVDPRQQFPNLRPASEDPYGDPGDR